MTDICETVKVKDAQGGFYIINACDFVEGTHVLFDETGTQDENKPTKKRKATQQDE